MLCKKQYGRADRQAWENQKQWPWTIWLCKHIGRREATMMAWWPVLWYRTVRVGRQTDRRGPNRHKRTNCGRLKVCLVQNNMGVQTDRQERTNCDGLDFYLIFTLVQINMGEVTSRREPTLTTLWTSYKHYKAACLFHELISINMEWKFYIYCVNNKKRHSNAQQETRIIC